MARIRWTLAMCGLVLTAWAACAPRAGAVFLGRNGVIVLPRDAALAPGGRVPLARLSADTRRATRQLATVLRSRLATRPAK